MKEPTIYMNGKEVPLTEALKKMTDEWVDDGNYCAQTVIDLRNALKKSLKEIKRGLKEIKKGLKEIEKQEEYAYARASEYIYDE
jgi:polyhydroxyalkanoate synthesis regulator phasin